MRWKVKGGEEEEGGLGTDRTRNEIDRRLPVVRVGRLATYQSRQVVDTLVPSSPSFSPRLPTFQSRTSTTTITLGFLVLGSKERRNVVARAAFKEIVP